MKRKINLFLLGMLMLGIGGIFTSCNDDDLTEEEKREQQVEEDNEQYLLAADFWRVVGQLSNAEVLPDNWQDETFEPGIGIPSDKSATTRIVLTNDARAAVESFANLTGADVTNHNIYIWKHKIGTLTYERINDGTGWASVDVDIKQMPGLKRIIYCTPEQQGLNATFSGTPYYRFGDVIKKRNDLGDWEYWVCVRPCFSPEGKGDMHWMCLGNLSSTDYETLEYKGSQWWWHKSLTTKVEHIKNLTEMTYAIMNPDEWMDYYTNNPKKNLFHDFTFNNIAYHNRHFWKMVQNAWNEPLKSGDEAGKTVFELVMRRKMSEVKADTAINFFYGKAQGPRRTWPINLQVARLKFTDFRTIDIQSYSKRADQYKFDIREYSKTGHGVSSTYFIRDAYIYPLRYATGQQLLGSDPGYYQSMAKVNGIEDVYVFNKRYNQEIGSGAEMVVFTEMSSKIKPMKDVAKEDIGKLLAKNGKIYDNAETAKKDGTEAVAMIVATKEDNFRFTKYDGSAADANGLISHSTDSHEMLKNALAISLDCWRKDIYNNNSIVGEDFGASGNVENDKHYVSSNGLGQWVAATSYFWQRAIAGSGDDAEIWTYENMLNRWRNEVGKANDTKYPHKDCKNLVELLKKQNVELYTANGHSEFNLLRDGGYFDGVVYRWVFDLDPTFPENSVFLFYSTLNTAEKRQGVLRPFYVW